MYVRAICRLRIALKVMFYLLDEIQPRYFSEAPEMRTSLVLLKSDVFFMKWSDTIRLSLGYFHLYYIDFVDCGSVWVLAHV